MIVAVMPITFSSATVVMSVSNSWFAVTRNEGFWVESVERHCRTVSNIDLKVLRCSWEDGEGLPSSECLRGADWTTPALAKSSLTCETPCVLRPGKWLTVLIWVLHLCLYLWCFLQNDGSLAVNCLVVWTCCYWHRICEPISESTVDCTYILRPETWDTCCSLHNQLRLLNKSECPTQLVLYILSLHGIMQLYTNKSFHFTLQS